MFLANIFTRGVPKGYNTYNKLPGREGLVDDLIEKAFVDYDRTSMED